MPAAVPPWLLAPSPDPPTTTPCKLLCLQQVVRQSLALIADHHVVALRSKVAALP